jgi:hypothetical protein
LFDEKIRGRKSHVRVPEKLILGMTIVEGNDFLGIAISRLAPF